MAITISGTARLTGRWPILWLLVIVRIGMGYQFQAAAGASPWLIGEFGVDYASIGSLVGFYTLPGILISMPGGYLARWIGEKPLLLAGLAAMTVGGLLSGFAGSFEAVFAGRIVSACGVVLLFVVMTKAVGDWFEGGERFLAMALFLNGWPLGMALALLVQPALGGALGWDWIFLSSAALTAVGFLAMWTSFRHPPSRTATASSADKRLGLRAIVLVMLAGFAWSVVNGGHISVISFAPSLLAARGLDAVEAGALVSLNLWGMIVGVTLGGWATSRLRWPVTITCIGALAGAGAAAMVALDDHYALWLIVSGLAVLLGAGVQAALPLEALTPATRTTGLGLFYTCWYSGFALLPWAAGWTRDLTGDAAAPILFGAASIALTIPLLLLFRLFQGRWGPAAAAANS
jgi:predicted MFS family arabinose efflux permease